MVHGHTHPVHPPHDEESHGRHDWMEISAAVLLALATIASAWSAYQAARWGGYEAKKFAAATAHRIESTKAAELADQEAAVDRGLAYLAGEQDEDGTMLDGVVWDQYPDA